MAGKRLAWRERHPAATAVCPSPLRVLAGAAACCLLLAAPHCPSDKGGCPACCAGCASPFTESADSHTAFLPAPPRAGRRWGPGARVPEGRPGCSPGLGLFCERLSRSEATLTAEPGWKLSGLSEGSWR